MTLDDYRRLRAEHAKIVLPGGILALIVITLVAAQSIISPQKYAVRVLDFAGDGERRAMIVMGGEPFLFQYGNVSFGTVELCLVSRVRTCFRSSRFDATKPEVQYLHLELVE